jgi:hypothetical protein
MSLYFFLYLQEKIYDSLWVISITRGYYRKESAALDPQANTESLKPQIYLKTKYKIISIWLTIHLHVPIRATKRGEGGIGRISLGSTLIGPQLESESLKLSRFFKLVR